MSLSWPIAFRGEDRFRAETDTEWNILPAAKITGRFDILGIRIDGNPNGPIIIQDRFLHVNAGKASGKFTGVVIRAGQLAS
jgi:hypothetical protein